MITAASNECPYDGHITMEMRMVADYLIYRNYSFNKAIFALSSSDLIRKESDLYSVDAISSSYWSRILTQLLACFILCCVLSARQILIYLPNLLELLL